MVPLPFIEPFVQARQKVAPYRAYILLITYGTRRISYPRIKKTSGLHAICDLPTRRDINIELAHADFILVSTAVNTSCYMVRQSNTCSQLC